MSGKNRIVKYFLNNWSYYDQNVGYLSACESIRMKILYQTLKEMDPEERKFLANKYRVAKKPIISDAVLAKQQGLSLMEYREKRIKVETRMKSILQKYEDLHEEELSKARGFVYKIPAQIGRLT